MTISDRCIPYGFNILSNDLIVKTGRKTTSARGRTTLRGGLFTTRGIVVCYSYKTTEDLRVSIYSSRLISSKVFEIFVKIVIGLLYRIGRRLLYEVCVSSRIRSPVLIKLISSCSCSRTYDVTISISYRSLDRIARMRTYIRFGSS